jgi:transmembrane sensor
MSQLRFPLKDHLIDPVGEAALHRIALAIDERTQGRKRRRFFPLVLVGATAAVVAIVMAISHGHHDAGPLLLADGRDMVAVEAGAGPSEIALADGSRIQLSLGARIEPLASTDATFSAIVVQGRADFEVRPGGPRHWVIECGLATVEVIGTAFSCEREPGRLHVEVRHGVVLVRGERIPDRARRLSAGESLDLKDDAGRLPTVTGPDSAWPAPSEKPGLSPPTPAEDTVDLANREDRVHERRTAAPKTWRELAQRGRPGDAYAALGTEGLRRESRRLGVSDLLALADVARLSGHPAEAVMPLERNLSDFSNDAQAPLAAFALGRLELDFLGRAHAAAAAFRRALALGIPRSLREDVRARLVEAYARSGDGSAAQSAADAYADEFPEGRHTQAIRGWLQRR